MHRQGHLLACCWWREWQRGRRRCRAPIPPKHASKEPGLLLGGRRKGCPLLRLNNTHGQLLLALLQLLLVDCLLLLVDRLLLLHVVRLDAPPLLHYGRCCRCHHMLCSLRQTSSPKGAHWDHPTPLLPVR